MIKKFLTQTIFKDFEDFKRNYQLNIPENFNFGYDIVDEWATNKPTKRVLLWTNDKGECSEFTFAEKRPYLPQ
jgi:acetyl-CoA synthetase